MKSYSKKHMNHLSIVSLLESSVRFFAEFNNVKSLQCVANSVSDLGVGVARLADERNLTRAAHKKMHAEVRKLRAENERLRRELVAVCQS